MGGYHTAIQSGCPEWIREVNETSFYREDLRSVFSIATQELEPIFSGRNYGPSS